MADDPWDKQRLDAEAAVRDALYAFWDGQQKRLLRTLHASRDELLAARQHWQETQAGTASKAAGNPELTYEVDWSAEQQLMQEALQLALDAALATALTQVAQHIHTLKVPVAWDVYDAQAADLAKNYRYDLIKDLNDSTRTMLGGTIGKWIESDEDFDQLVQRMRTIVPASGRPGLRDRGQLVAATEVTRVYADSRLAGMQAAGLTQVVWRCAEDEIACPTCRALGHANDGEGAIGSVGSRTFLNPENGQQYEMPAHPSCRCFCVESTDELQALADTYGETEPGDPPDVMGFSWWRPELGVSETVDQAQTHAENPQGWDAHQDVFNQYSASNHVKVRELERTIGLWGNPEPSFNARVVGKHEDVDALARAWRDAFKQEAVVVLYPNKVGTGGILSWDFGRELSNAELDRLLAGVKSVDARLRALDESNPLSRMYLGLTVKDHRYVEYWVPDADLRGWGERLLQEAMELAGFQPPNNTWQGGFDFESV